MSRLPILAAGPCACLLIAHAAWAAEAAPAAPTVSPPDGDEPSLPTISVRAARPFDVVIDKDRPVSTIGTAEIQRRQLNSIFDVVKDVPGVSVDGGPRASGMKFNIRGFSDNDDVLFKIDGAVKGFEKYRFGSGVFIEPELLKAIEVQRGPAITSGSGALGGTISATTQSANDLLRPGQQVGALAKTGYAWNNAEQLRMLALYGRLSDQWSWLGAATHRQSEDIQLADGSKLSASTSQSDSSLLKLSWRPQDDLQLELGRVAYNSGPERAPYDATAGEPDNTFGIVRRRIDDQTLNLRLSYTPEASLIQLRGLISHERTHLVDLALQSENSATFTYLPGVPGKTNGTGDRTDDWNYDIWSAELFNDMHWAAGEFKGTLTLGWQGVRNERTLQRWTQNPRYNAPDASYISAYPNGFYAAQPPGGKRSTAWIAEHALSWQDLTLTPGVRWDDYQLKAGGGTLDILKAAGQSDTVRFTHTTPSLRLNWLPSALARQWSFTVSQADSFKPPLIDEAFTNGVFSRCLRSAGTPLALYDKTTGVDLAPKSNICGDLYRPEVSTTRELSVAWDPEATLLGARWQAKASHFKIDTRHTLNSLSARDGEVQQPGTEHRFGTELELRADGRSWFGSWGYSRVAGQVSGEGLSLTQAYSGAIYDVPGPTTTLNLGARALSNRFEAGFRVRDVGDRLAIVPVKASSCSVPSDVKVAGLGNGNVGTQFGMRLFDVYASYRISLNAWNDVMVKLAVDNATNELYCLNDGFGGGVGTQAPGRNVKLQLVWRM
ncbi:MAG: TonB-dependent receptor plug domain-containing protein [Aquabacterium sp.]